MSKKAFLELVRFVNDTVDDEVRDLSDQAWAREIAWRLSYYADESIAEDRAAMDYVERAGMRAIEIILAKIRFAVTD